MGQALLILLFSFLTLNAYTQFEQFEIVTQDSLIETLKVKSVQVVVINSNKNESLFSKRYFDTSGHLTYEQYGEGELFDSYSIFSNSDSDSSKIVIEECVYRDELENRQLKLLLSTKLYNYRNQILYTKTSNDNEIRSTIYSYNNEGYRTSINSFEVKGDDSVLTSQCLFYYNNLNQTVKFEKYRLSHDKLQLWLSSEYKYSNNLLVETFRESNYRLNQKRYTYIKNTYNASGQLLQEQINSGYGYFGLTMPPLSVKPCRFERRCNYTNLLLV